jgi:hypothetical protein
MLQSLVQTVEPRQAINGGGGPCSARVPLVKVCPVYTQHAELHVAHRLKEGLAQVRHEQ